LKQALLFIRGTNPEIPTDLVGSPAAWISVSEKREPTFEELLAWSLDAEPEILEFLPGLFQDLEELGVRVRDVLRVLGKSQASADWRALDLACGKGAVAIALAEKFGCSVRGVDGMSAFIEHARDRAAAMGVSELCVFDCADVHDDVSQSRDYDLVCLNAFGGALGRLDEAVGSLRECVVPGGLILIDDAYLREGVQNDGEFSFCFDHAATVELLTAHGDEVLEELVVDGADSVAHYQWVTSSIVARAEELATQHPESAALLRGFAARQAAEVEVLAGPVVGALWLLRRAV